MTRQGTAGRFDGDYYQRYYLDPRTAVTSRVEMQARGRLIAALADHIGLPVRRIFDVGCGLGLLRAPLRKAFPRASYTGMEVSEYLCKRHGWRQGSIESLATRERFDIVICYDVLQYLSDRDARRAIANLARVCRGVLYFGALTREDWRHNCDRKRTDGAAFLRPGDWYRKLLNKSFTQMGAGFWLRRSMPLSIWELDTAGKLRR